MANTKAEKKEDKVTIEVEPEVVETVAEKKEDKVTIEVEPEVVETVAEKKEDKVTIMIPYVEGQGTEITVGVNGVFTKIKKGVMVEVSRPVAEVIMNSLQQVMVAEANQERMKMQVQDLG